MLKQKRRYNYFRLPLQWLVLVLLAYMLIRGLWDTQYTPDFEAYCPFGGLQAISSYLVTDTLACSMTSVQMAIGLALIICIILFSKLFCSYVCPVGTFTEWIGGIGEKLGVRFTLKGFADRALRILKYGLLFITFYFTIESSELFCKKFDPYYAAFSGFGSDVVIWYAAISLGVVVAGSFFIRQAWCKYLCPLSAATNVFSNFLLFGTIIIIYLQLWFVFEIKLHWVWLLSSITILTFLREAVFMKTTVFPLLKITRYADTCTLCGTCNKACPMAIKVSEVARVDHIDCNLCGDCVAECPEPGVLQINQKKISWLPTAAVVVLSAAALIFASFTEIATISDKWGTEEQLETAKVYELSGIKSIKCYGSSVSFAGQMRNVTGVLGVETYVGTHKVKVFYNAALINEADIKKAIFTPSSAFLNNPGVNKIGALELKIQNYFDSYDEYYLTQLLAANAEIYGFSTSFGEPVNAKIYFNPAKLNPDKIKKIIESPELRQKDDGGETVQELNFKVNKSGEKYEVIDLHLFYAAMAEPMDDTFNKFSSYKASEMSEYRIAVTPFNKDNASRLIYLESHLSNDPGITRFRTVYENDSVFAIISYVKAKTGPTTIFKLLNVPKLKVYYSDGTSEETDNPFAFTKEGKTEGAK